MKIRKIVRVEEKVSVAGEKYHVTTVLLDSGNEEYSGYGKDWSLGEKVIPIFHAQYNRLKIIKSK